MPGAPFSTNLAGSDHAVTVVVPNPVIRTAAWDS